MHKSNWLRWFASPLYANYGGDDTMYPQDNKLPQTTPFPDPTDIKELEDAISTAADGLRENLPISTAAAKEAKPKLSFLEHTRKIIQEGFNVAKKETDRLAAEITRYEAESAKYLDTLRKDLEEATTVLNAHEASLATMSQDAAPTPISAKETAPKVKTSAPATK